MIYPKTLAKVIEYFQKLPGIGEKSAERLALSSLTMSEDDVKAFSEALTLSKVNLKKCSVCGHITENDICNICQEASEGNRTKNLICVLEDYKSVFTFEKAGNYKGVYHVLDGLISPSEGITPDDINFSSLIKRINELEEAELIIALKSTVEGETTTLYIKKIFENKPVEISRLSYGIPMGAEIDYLDSITLDRAISDRKKIS